MRTDNHLSGEQPDPIWVQEECARLDAQVDRFAALMKARLHQKAEAGWTRWHNREHAKQTYTSMLAQAAAIPMARGREVDIANLAMFLKLFNDGADYGAEESVESAEAR